MKSYFKYVGNEKSEVLKFTRRYKVPSDIHGKTKLMRKVRFEIGVMMSYWEGLEQWDKVMACKYLRGFIFNTEPIWTSSGYRGEYTCPCGVGHGNHVHGCCGEQCCQRNDYPLRAEREQMKLLSEQEMGD